MIDAINLLTNGVEARINDAGDGVILVDTAGGAGTLGVTDLSGDIAKSLNLTRAARRSTSTARQRKVIDGSNSVHDRPLRNLQSSSAAVPLVVAQWRQRRSATATSASPTPPARRSPSTSTTADAGITTVGQLIDAINNKATAGGVGVVASIERRQDRHRTRKITAGGSLKLKVEEIGNGTAAKDLKILGEATKIGGKQIINGAGAFTAASGTQTGLSALAAKHQRPEGRRHRLDRLRRLGLPPQPCGQRHRRRPTSCSSTPAPRR